MARLIPEINPKINLRDLVGLILVMMRPGHDTSLVLLTISAAPHECFGLIQRGGSGVL